MYFFNKCIPCMVLGRLLQRYLSHYRYRSNKSQLVDILSMSLTSQTHLSVAVRRVYIICRLNRQGERQVDVYGVCVLFIVKLKRTLFAHVARYLYSFESSPYHICVYPLDLSCPVPLNITCPIAECRPLSPPLYTLLKLQAMQAYDFRPWNRRQRPFKFTISLY